MEHDATRRGQVGLGWCALAVFVMLAVACGGGGDPAATPDAPTATAGVDAPPSPTTPTSAPTALPGPTPTVPPGCPDWGELGSTTLAGSSAPAADVSAAPDTVAAVWRGPPDSGDGWLLPAGVWSFDPLGSATFTSDRDLSTLRAGSSGIIFGPPGLTMNAQVNIVVLTDYSGVVSPELVTERGPGDTSRSTWGDPVPVDGTIGTWLSTIPAICIASTGTETVAALDTAWTEFTVMEGADSYRCTFGNSCLNTVVAAGYGPFEIGTSYRYRIWEIPTAPDPTLLWMQSRPEAWDATLDIAHTVLGSLTFDAS